MSISDVIAILTLIAFFIGITSMIIALVFIHKYLPIIDKYVYGDRPLFQDLMARGGRFSLYCGAACSKLHNKRLFPKADFTKLPRKIILWLRILSALGITTLVSVALGYIILRIYPNSLN